MTEQEARAVLEKVAVAWCTRPSDAAAYFAEDALYLEPPDRQRYVGRTELAEFFGPEPLRMQWHGIGFDAGTDTAYGEYTFGGRRQYHGVVVVRFAGGLITSWREYQYESPLPYAEFAQL